MLHLYKTSTGELISSATVIDIIPDGMSVKESDKKGVWNAEALDFIEQEVEKVLLRDDFLDLLTDDEMLNFVKSEDVNIINFLAVLSFKGRVRMSAQTTIDALNLAESIFILEAGRAGVILNG